MAALVVFSAETTVVAPAACRASRSKSYQTRATGLLRGAVL